ncbi:MAG TPA: hypothetical protein VL860_09465, partial [Planctomycetota bacterium]|nr:hypothetical protein [Planctomycetota bacterium]
GGLSALRNRLATLYRTTVLKRRASEALTQISELDTVHVPASIRDGMVPLKRQAMQLLLTVGAWR